MGLVRERTVKMSEERAARLSELASRQETTEDAVIERALDLLFDLSASGDDRTGWRALGEAAADRVWANEADATYDDWRNLYGVPQG